MGMNLVDIGICIQEDVYRMELCGELDACSAIVLDEALNKAVNKQPQHIYINCGKLTYISSAGLGAFIAHLQELKDKKINLVLYNVTPAIRYIFELIGLDQLITLQAYEVETNGQVQKENYTRLPMVTNHLNS
jgi:anti-sigma B factor antagonist